MSASEPAVLEAVGLGREYGPVVAVKSIDLALQAGESLVIFGPNGAGKTTLLGMLGGAIRPSTGLVRVHGEPITDADNEWRKRIGILSHRGFLYGRLTCRENLSFYAELFDLPDADDRVDAGLSRVGLADRAHTEARQLSHGMRQRLSLARALLHDPNIVLLDEPYTGLDPSAASVLRSVLEELRDGKRTIVAVTHNLREGVAMATRVVIQDRGRFVWEGPSDAFDAAGFERHYHATIEQAAA